MKYNLSLLALVAASQTIFAAPHGRMLSAALQGFSHSHNLGHRHHHKRDPDPATVTSTASSLNARDVVVQTVTENQSKVVVWVDQQGHPITTVTQPPGDAVTIPTAQAPNPAEATPTASINAPNPAIVEPSAPALEPAPPAAAPSTTVDSVKPTPAPVMQARPEKPADDTRVATSTSGLGITYSPYNDDSSCKSADQLKSELAKVSSAGYSLVRLYGVDCNQVAGVMDAAAQGTKVLLGVTELPGLSDNLNKMAQQVNGRWDSVTGISIGNELVNTRKNPPSDVINAVASAKGQLKGAGYNGPVFTVDTQNAIQDHPELCSDGICAANCHAYFNAELQGGASGAGAWVAQQVDAIKQKAGSDKRVIITESGWPHAGNANGGNIPSIDEQGRAIGSLKAAFNQDLFMFTAFDDKWKGVDSFNVERNWGMIDQH